MGPALTDREMFVRTATEEKSESDTGDDMYAELVFAIREFSPQRSSSTIGRDARRRGTDAGCARIMVFSERLYGSP